MKTQKKLMVVGSSVEEEKVYIGRNQVGIQMDNTSKENMQTGEDQVLQKRVLSNKLNIKINRRVNNELNDNAKLDRSFKP